MYYNKTNATQSAKCIISIVLLIHLDISDINNQHRKLSQQKEENKISITKKKQKKQRIILI